MLINSTPALASSSSAPSRSRCAAMAASAEPGGACWRPSRTARMAARAQRSVRRRCQWPRRWRSPTEPVPSTMSRNSRARRSSSPARSGTPAHSQIARVSGRWAASNSATSPSRIQPRAASSQWPASRAGRRPSASGRSSCRNSALRRAWSSPSSAITDPKSWIRVKAGAGRAPRRVKRPGTQNCAAAAAPDQQVTRCSISRASKASPPSRRQREGMKPYPSRRSARLESGDASRGISGRSPAPHRRRRPASCRH